MTILLNVSIFVYVMMYSGRNTYSSYLLSTAGSGKVTNNGEDFEDSNIKLQGGSNISGTISKLN